MLSVLLNAAIASVILLLGAFFVGIFQSIVGNKKLNLQGINKQQAIQKVAEVVTKEWRLSAEDNLWRRTHYIAQAFLSPLGFDKKSVDSMIHAWGTDYYSNLMTSQDEEMAISMLTNLILREYSQNKALQLTFSHMADEQDIHLVLLAVREAKQKYQNK